MQATLPTHQVPVQIVAVEPSQRLYPVANIASAALYGATISLIGSSCALLGEKILQAAGNQSFNLPSFGHMLVPALVGSTVVFGGLGLLKGLCSPGLQTT